MKSKFLTIFIWLTYLGSYAYAQNNLDLELKIDSLVNPLVATNNYSGTILVSKNGHTLFTKAYGKMNLDNSLENNYNTKFFLASLSMIFTSAAVLKLQEYGKLSIYDKLSKYYPEYNYGDSITLHQMLAQRSGIPAIGYYGNIDYDSITKLPQTTESLISYFRDYDLLFSPNEKYYHGRSEYIMLANIIEKVSGKSFGGFLEDEIFNPLRMFQTKHFKSDNEIINDLATGYTPKDLYDVEPAKRINWTSKTGHASIYSTVGDLNKFGTAILNNELLSPDSQKKIFTNHGNQVGYGWFIRPHLGRTRYQMNGKSPGYSSYFAIYPEDNLLIIVLSNNFIPLPAQIGMTIAAMVFGEHFEILNTSYREVDFNYSKKLAGTYKFNKDFYVPNYELKIKYNNGHLNCQWGDLIPIDNGEKNLRDFILRTYWSSIHFIKDKSDEFVEMEFDEYIGVKIK